MEAASTTDLARAGTPPQVPRTTPAARGETILIVEDEADQRAIVTSCLEIAGDAPLGVVSGDLVVAAARAAKPALILLDIAIPHLDAYSVCRLLKADPELAAIPVIWMTPFSSVAMLEKLALLKMALCSAPRFLTLHPSHLGTLADEAGQAIGIDGLDEVMVEPVIGRAL